MCLDSSGWTRGLLAHLLKQDTDETKGPGLNGHTAQPVLPDSVGQAIALASLCHFTFHAPQWEVTNEKGRGCGWTQANPYPQQGKECQAQVLYRGPGKPLEHAGTTTITGQTHEFWLEGVKKKKKKETIPITMVTITIPLARGGLRREICLQRKRVKARVLFRETGQVLESCTQR